MTWEDAKQELKRPEVLERFIEQQRTEYRRGRNFRCLHPSHVDNNPSMTFYPDTSRVYCHACQENGDIFDVIAWQYGVTPRSREAIEVAFQHFGVEPNRANSVFHQALTGHSSYSNSSPSDQSNEASEHKKAENFSNFFREAQQHIRETDYLLQRGIGYETAEAIGVGFAQGYVIFPTSPSSYNSRFAHKDAPKGQRFRKAGSGHVFNVGALWQNESPIFVVEGEIDALSIIEAGGQAIALAGTGRTPLLRVLDEQKPRQPVVMALDNDTAGKENSRRLNEELFARSIFFYQADIAWLYDGLKDANDALQNDRQSFTERIEEAAIAATGAREADRIKALEEYQQNSAAAQLKGFFDGINDSINTPPTPTGFELFDGALDGGLYEGLYVIGAITSLGKSTFLLQIADQIAQQGHDVLFFSLEMARYELMAKSISRETLQRASAENINPNNAKTVRGITDGRRWEGYNAIERELLHDATEAYRSYADHIFISEGNGDIGAMQIREAVKRHISITGRKPVVFVDYLQILAPHDPRATDKQNTDRVVIGLKRLSRDFKLPVVAISSFNRENYNLPVGLTAFKESGAVEYSSDVLIGLQYAAVRRSKSTRGSSGSDRDGADFDIATERERNPREIELVILKARNGRTHQGIAFEYYPLFNYYREATDR